jgi:hypothetical protein
VTFIYLNLDSGVAMYKKGLCKKVSSCGTNRKTCYISGRSVLLPIIIMNSLHLFTEGSITKIFLNKILYQNLSKLFTYFKIFMKTHLVQEL